MEHDRNIRNKRLLNKLYGLGLYSDKNGYWYLPNCKNQWMMSSYSDNTVKICEKIKLDKKFNIIYFSELGNDYNTYKDEKYIYNTVKKLLEKSKELLYKMKMNNIQEDFE